MGLIYAEVELINGYDEENVRRGYIGADEIRKLHCNMLVDTDVLMLCINENIQALLQFPFAEKRVAQTADGRLVECDVVKGVELRFKNRRSTLRAMVLPGDSQPLLGAFAIEDMDVLIDAQRQELIVNPEHPYYAHAKLKTTGRAAINYSDCLQA